MCAAREARAPNAAGRTTRGRRARGATLVEVVFFIVIVSIALSTIVKLLGFAAGRSADPVVVRQSLAIAESLLQEIEAQPVSLKDPDDPNGPDEAIGPEPGESRTSATLPFDHVDDYDGYVETGIVRADGSPVAGLEGYTARVSVKAQALAPVPAVDGFLIKVSVTGPGGIPVTLTGLRTRTRP